MRCASYSPAAAVNAEFALYSIAKPASVPIHISPSKSAANAVTFCEGRSPEKTPVLKLMYASSEGSARELFVE